MLNWGFTSFKSMTLTWKVLPFPLQDRSSWPRLVSSAQRLLVLGWAVGVGGAQSPEIVHTEREDKVNAETERDRMCYERKKEKEKRKHLQMSSIMSINIFWTLDNEYSPFSSKIFELFGELVLFETECFCLTIHVMTKWGENKGLYVSQMHLLRHREYRSTSLAQTVYHHSRLPSSGGQTIGQTQAETQELVVLNWFRLTSKFINASPFKYLGSVSIFNVFERSSICLPNIYFEKNIAN